MKGRQRLSLCLNDLTHKYERLLSVLSVLIIPLICDSQIRVIAPFPRPGVNLSNIIWGRLYNNVTSVCIFIGCRPWSVKGHTDGVKIHVRSRQQTCFSFPMPHKYFNKSFEFLFYKTNRLHFSVCVYCNRSQKTSQRVKNNSHATRLRLWHHLWSITVHTHGKMLSIC